MATATTCPVLVGRREQMDVLAAALAQGGGLVLVAGEAGLGKTRLLREFAQSPETHGHVFAWGRPEAMTSPGPYSLIVDLLEDLASVAPGGMREAHELAEDLEDRGASLAPRQVAARTRGLVARLGPNPVMIAEDLHAADELSQAVIAHLARSARDDGILLLATYRPEEAQGGSATRLLDLLRRDRLATRIDLTHLGGEELVVMLEAMWGSPPSQEDLEVIARLADGVPFFVEELAAARVAGAESIPPTIARAVLTRMQALDAPALKVMRVASLMAGVLDPVVLADASGVGEREVPRCLLSAVTAGLLADQEGRLAFRHALVREAISETIVSVERRDIHRRVAAAIERHHGARLGPYAHALAVHLAGAGDSARAAEYHVLAGRRALDAGALDEAGAAFASALALEQQDGTMLEALEGCAEVGIRTREFEEAAKALRRAADGWVDLRRPVEGARCLVRLAWVRQSAAGDRVAVEIFDEALALLTGCEDDPQYARVLVDKGYALARVFEDPDGGEAVLLEGVARADKLGDTRLTAEATEGLAWVSEFRGDVVEAETRGKEACRLALAAGEDELIGKTHGNQALRLAMRGRLQEALTYLEEARAFLVRGTGTLYVHTIDHLRAWLLWRMGAPAEADRTAGRLEATRWARHYAGVVRVWAAVERGDEDAARRIIVSWWEDLGGEMRHLSAVLDPGTVAEDGSAALALLAELIMRVHGAGPADAATVEFARSYNEFSEDSAPDMRLLVLLLYARSLVLAGRIDEAAQRVQEAEHVLMASPYHPHEATVAELKGLIEKARSGSGAVGHFDRAAEILAECSNVSDRARCLRLAAESLSERREEAITRLKAARELALAAGAIVEVNTVERCMRELGLRPRAGRPKGSGRSTRGLSTREEEVVVLVAAGATNAEIARRLFLSERTVQDHIANSQRRLGVSGRAGLAAWAAKQGLI
ncbi:MAG: AAA family ATPase [Actinomycetota bacterium]